MNETSIRRRSSASKEARNITATRLGGKTSSIDLNLASSSYPPVVARSRESEDIVNVEFEVDEVDDKEQYLGMARNSAYHQLPNSHASPKKSNGSLTNSLGLAKWQRNALIGVVALMVFMYAASSSRVLPNPTSKANNVVSEYNQDSQILPEDGVVQKPDWKEQVVGGEDAAPIETSVSGGGKKMSPTSKPDLSPSAQKGALTNCQLPSGKPEIQYALMIDAGSTGSRMHVYTFSNCLPAGQPLSEAQNALPTLKEELFYPITPGLSSYKGNPKAAAKSLQEIMQKALKAVPESERSCTPIAVKATAGLRLLGKKESQDILNEVERYLREEWPFHVVEDGVVIMDGKDEGVYAWITINYLLGLVGPGKNTGASAAVMDLGGASTQIVFEPRFPSNSKLSPGDHVYDLNFASTKHTLYQHSHLGYGLMQARRSVHNLVAFTYVWQSMTRGKAMEWEDLSANDQIPNPCLVKGGKKTVLLDPPGRKAVNVTFIGTGAGFEACRRVVDVVMAKDALCEVEPCAFGGVYQPQLMETFGSGPIYALSYFYDRIVPLGLGTDSSPFTIAELRELSTDVCAGPHPSGRVSSSTKGWSRFKGNMEAMAELEGRPEYCLDLSFMYSLLSLGYELGDTRELVTGKKIADIELGWALGAGIALLEHSSLQCRNPDN